MKTREVQRMNRNALLNMHLLKARNAPGTPPEFPAIVEGPPQWWGNEPWAGSFTCRQMWFWCHRRGTGKVSGLRRWGQIPLGAPKEAAGFGPVTMGVEGL